MKIAPAALFYQITGENSDPFVPLSELAAMTHYTDMAVLSCISQFNAIRYCLSISPNYFSKKFFLNDTVEMAIGASNECISNFDPKLNMAKDRLGLRLSELYSDGVWSDDKIRNQFGQGTCYVYNSLPFSYAFFLRGYEDINCLFDVVNAGGDTDTNGSIVGALLGALHGHEIFPEELIEELEGIDYIDSLIELFLKKFAEQ